MPQLANLILTDRAAIPVARTFTPRAIEKGKATLVNNTGVPAGESKITINGYTNAAGRVKSSANLVVPTLATETVNGVSNPKVVRTAYAYVEFSFDALSTEQERKDAVGML